MSRLFKFLQRRPISIDFGPKQNFCNAPPIFWFEIFSFWSKHPIHFVVDAVLILNVIDVWTGYPLVDLKHDFHLWTLLMPFILYRFVWVFWYHQIIFHFVDQTCDIHLFDQYESMFIQVEYCQFRLLTSLRIVNHE